MNRELEFRFWSPEGIMMDDHAGWVEDIGINYALHCSKKMDYIIMQYTGKKDKKGIKIFEGDICRTDANGTLWVVKFNDYSWRFCNYDIPQDKWKKMGGDQRYSFDVYFMLLKKVNANIEVIGNIYQNSEMIIPCQQSTTSE